MGFFKSLFGSEKPKSIPAPEKEMEGNEVAVIALIYQSSHLVSIENQESLNETGRARFPWTPHKQQKFLEQFALERFVFDGEVKSMCIINFFVERDLTGYLHAGLYSQRLEEIDDYKEKWGEAPKPVGMLHLQFRDGKPNIDVTKFDAAPGAPSKWTNRNKQRD